MFYKEEEEDFNEKEKSNKEKEDLYKIYDEKTQEIENNVNQIINYLEDPTQISRKQIEKNLNNIFLYYCFCSDNKITNHFSLNVNILLDLIEKEDQFSSLFHKILLILNKMDLNEEFSDYFFEERSTHCLLFLLKIMNDSSLIDNIQFQADLCNFIMILINNQQKFQLFVDNGFIDFLSRNIPRNFAINSINVLCPFMNETSFTNLFDIFVQSIESCYDELAICNMLKCIIHLYKESNDPLSFNFTGKFIDLIKNFIHPKNPQLAKIAMNLIYEIFPESFGILHDFLSYIPYYYDEKCSYSASLLLDKFYLEWKEQITTEEIKILLNQFPLMEYSTAATIFPSFLKYIDVNADLENDFLATQMCERYLDQLSDKTFVDSIISFINRIIQIHFIQHTSESDDFLNDLMQFIPDIAEKIDENENIEENEKIIEFNSLYQTITQSS